MSLVENSFMRSLCMGKIEEDILLPFPQMQADKKETIQMIFDTLSSWLAGREEDFRTWDQEGSFPPQFLEEIKENGLFGLVIPEEYGGIGLNAQCYARVLGELSRYDASLAITVGAHSSIGMKGLLLFGTDAQKNEYLPKLATGEMIASFCLTEAGAGSDAANAKTKAELKGDHWELSGEKIWVTNGGWADFFTVFAKTDTPEGKMTAFIVNRSWDGVTTGAHEDKMGIRANSTTTLYLDKVKVPSDHVLGQVGKGFKIAMSILNNGRIGLGGGCIGTMKQCIELATDHALNRSQFGKNISNYGLIKQKIGHMVVQTYAVESVVNMVCHMIDSGHKDYNVEAAISKIFATESLWQTADEALQIAGGTGFMKELPYERIVRNCRINRIFEGTNDILQLFVSLTAMKDMASFLKDVSSSAKNVLNDPIKGFGLLSEYAIKKVSDATKVGRTPMKKVEACLNEYTQIFDNEAVKLTGAVERILLKHGKKVIEKQFANKRLAAIMIDLFVLASVLSRVSTKVSMDGEKESQKEIEILKVFTHQAQRRIQSNYKKIDVNDDESYKKIADNLYDIGHYHWDIL